MKSAALKGAALLTLGLLTICYPAMAKSAYGHRHVARTVHHTHVARHATPARHAKVEHHAAAVGESHSGITCEMVRAYVAQVGLAQATAMAQAVLDLLEIRRDQLHKLADVPLEQLLAVQNGGHGPSGKTAKLPGGFEPMLDGKVISQHPFVPGPAPYVANVPLLIGQNRDEATFFFRENPEVFTMDDAAMVARLRSQLGAENADALLPVFRRERPNASPVELFIAIATCGMWGGTLAEAESKVRQQGAPVYMYRYDYESNFPIKGTDWTLRAGHATEIQAKFENADFGGLIGTKPDRFQASRNFGEIWTRFARTGHPQAPGVKKWPAYDLSTRATLCVDAHCTLANDPNKAEREIVQTVMAKMEKRG